LAGAFGGGKNLQRSGTREALPENGRALVGPPVCSGFFIHPLPAKTGRPALVHPRGGGGRVCRQGTGCCFDLGWPAAGLPGVRWRDAGPGGGSRRGPRARLVTFRFAREPNQQPLLWPVSQGSCKRRLTNRLGARWLNTCQKTPTKAVATRSRRKQPLENSKGGIYPGRIFHPQGPKTTPREFVFFRTKLVISSSRQFTPANQPKGGQPTRGSLRRVQMSGSLAKKPWGSRRFLPVRAVRLVYNPLWDKKPT